MDATVATHPSREILTAYGLGKVDDATAETLHRHLEGCAQCREVVEQITADGFVARLKDVRGADSTPTPEGPLSRLASTIHRPNTEDAIPGQAPVAEATDHQDYEIIRELGRGGMGVVYLIRNKELGRQEVLKVMSEHLAAKPGVAERFRQEIRAASQLEHDNIVRVYSFVRPSGGIGFTMQFVAGKNLDEFVKDKGQLPITKACYYTYQVALGLQHAHEKGFVHRDIKPNNLILSVEGKKHRVKILDFGLAKATSEKEEVVGLTAAGAVMGTPSYMAPEQCLNAAKVDIRADIYSLGCSLYFLLSGHSPFRESSQFEMFYAHQKKKAKRLNVLRHDVPVELAELVAKMLAKKPDQRFQTPAEVAEALVPFFKPDRRPDVGVIADPIPGSGPKPPKPEPIDLTLPPEELPPPPPDDPEPPVSRRRGLLLVAIIGAAFVGLLGAWAGGVFKVKTKDGTIVLENVPKDAEVIVDGEKVTITRNGETATVKVNTGGAHKLKVVVGGREVYSSDLTVNIGGEPVRVRLETPNLARSEDAETKQDVTGNNNEPRDNPQPKALDRTYWADDDGQGHYVKVDDNKWRRVNDRGGGVTSTYRETARNEDYVEIHIISDPKSGKQTIQIRLYDNRTTWQWAGVRWHFNKSGSWKK